MRALSFVAAAAISRESISKYILPGKNLPPVFKCITAKSLSISNFSSSFFCLSKLLPHGRPLRGKSWKLHCF